MNPAQTTMPLFPHQPHAHHIPIPEDQCLLVAPAKLDGRERQTPIPLGTTPPVPRGEGRPDAYTLLSVMDMESSVKASLEISLSLALVAGAKT